MDNRDGINGMVQHEYFDKDVSFSSTDFCKNDYQLWVSKHYDKNEEEQGFKAWVGQLIHKASYEFPEIDVIKEYSFKLVHDLEHTIGGSIDRMVKLEDNTWQVEDIKTQGHYPAQKSFKEPSESWITQLSIYAWAMRKQGFTVSYKGVIHQYVMGYQKAKKLEGYEEYNKIEIDLMYDHEVDELINEKIRTAYNEIAPMMDCVTAWQCDYCSYSKACPNSKAKEK